MTTGLPVDHLVQTALAQYLGTSFHTLFQVSTSGSLVAGVFDGAVSVEELLRHGDFGLGTLAGLDGEMVVLEGTAYQAKGDGSVHALPGDAKAPFAVVTAFAGEKSRQIGPVSSFEELGTACDPARESENLFYALRVDGHFEHVHTRAVNPAPPGITLAEAARTQPEFHFENVDGTLVGIWSPVFSGAFSVPGYHFHFLSDDRTKSGHLLDCRGYPSPTAFRGTGQFPSVAARVRRLPPGGAPQRPHRRAERRGKSSLGNHPINRASSCKQTAKQSTADENRRADRGGQPQGAGRHPRLRHPRSQDRRRVQHAGRLRHQDRRLPP